MSVVHTSKHKIHFIRSFVCNFTDLTSETITWGGGEAIPSAVLLPAEESESPSFLSWTSALAAESRLSFPQLILHEAARNSNLEQRLHSGASLLHPLQRLPKTI